jgi:hypothetical protein
MRPYGRIPHTDSGDVEGGTMRYRISVAAVMAALIMAMTAAAPAVAGGAAKPAADLDPGLGGKSTVAVIGDIPYGAAKLASFPTATAQINADPDVSLVAHLGDIKNGSSLCSNDYFSKIRSLFDAFQDPFVYTPGDNEWTDCHRASNGGYVPTERLAEVRKDFFPVPGQTLGAHARQVLTQAVDPRYHDFVENTMWRQSGTIFSAVNLPGSNNDLVPWLVTRTATEQQSEYKTRLDADLDWLNKTFLTAALTRAKGVAILMQADMWDTSALAPGGDGLYGFDPIVARIGLLSALFARPVLILEGDSHTYRVDHPFTASDPLYPIHPLFPPGLQAPNVTRVVVDGSANANDYLKLTVDPSTAGVFGWTRVPFQP